MERSRSAVFTVIPAYAHPQTSTPATQMANRICSDVGRGFVGATVFPGVSSASATGVWTDCRKIGAVSVTGTGAFVKFITLDGLSGKTGSSNRTRSSSQSRYLLLADRCFRNSSRRKMIATAVIQEPTVMRQSRSIMALPSFHGLDHRLDLPAVLLRQLALVAERCKQAGRGAVENSAEEMLRLLHNALLFPGQGTV